MSTNEKKCVTVKVDAELHAEVKQYIEAHEMTMAEFMTLALQDEIHTQNNIREDKNMGNMRTMAFQVPEELFQKIKDYLQRNNMTQKQFVIGLIENEIERDLTQRAAVSEASTDSERVSEEHTEQRETAAVSDCESVSEEVGEHPRNRKAPIFRTILTTRARLPKTPMRTRIWTKAKIRTSPKIWECLWGCEIPHIMDCLSEYGRNFSRTIFDRL